MSGWAIANVSRDGWLLRSALPSQSPWRTSSRLARVGDAASVRFLTSSLPGPMPLVTPRDVETTSGTAVGNRVADDEGAFLGQDLLENDVLVPSRGHGACVLVTKEMSGVAFRGFHILRPNADVVDPRWLWAVLSCSSGLAARAALSSGLALPSVSATALAELPVPLVPMKVAHSAEWKALLPLPGFRAAADGAVRSSWNVRDLLKGEAWGAARAMILPVGTPLEEIASLWGGNVDKADWYGAPGPGRRPVLTHWAVRQHREPFQPWAEGKRTTTDSTIVVTRTQPFRVILAPAGVLLSKELLAIDIDLHGLEAPLAPELSRRRIADAATTYLSGREGQDSLAALARGATIQHLSISALRGMPIPPGVLTMGSQVRDVGSLAERLEAAVYEVLTP